MTTMNTYNNMKTIRTKLLATALCGIIASSLAQKVHAANLVQNGNFTSTTAGTGQLGYNTALTDWTTTGYNFVYESATVADSTGAVDQFPAPNNTVSFWGPDNPSPVANGFSASPAGPAFLALDSYISPGQGGISVGPVSQTINGLSVGQTYALSFYWAGAQQTGFTGPTTDQLFVSLGTETNSTPVISVASRGFTGWDQVTLDYVATSTSEVLSFLASGTPPVSDPPFALVDGVSLTQGTAPDTASTAGLFGLSVAALALAARCYGRQCRQ
jgi:hypothetical protein